MKNIQIWSWVIKKKNTLEVRKYTEQITRIYQNHCTT